MHWTRLTRAVPVLPLVLGITDGILNALTLAAGAILRSVDGVSGSLALRVGCAALVTAAFTMFIADYADRRAHLVRASRQLNLTEPGDWPPAGSGVRRYASPVSRCWWPRWSASSVLRDRCWSARPCLDRPGWCWC